MKVKHFVAGLAAVISVRKLKLQWSFQTLLFTPELSRIFLAEENFHLKFHCFQTLELFQIFFPTRSYKGAKQTTKVQFRKPGHTSRTRVQIKTNTSQQLTAANFTDTSVWASLTKTNQHPTRPKSRNFQTLKAGHGHGHTWWSNRDVKSPLLTLLFVFSYAHWKSWRLL